MGERPGSLRVDFPDLSDPAAILTGAVLRHYPAAPVPAGRREAFLEARRPEPLPEAPRTPWHQPPSATLSAAPLAWRAESYGPPVPWAAGVEDISARGTALHLAARVFLTEQRGREGALMDATGLAETDLAALADQMEALLRWLRARGTTRLLTELPLQHRHPDGRETTGIADLVALGPDGALLIDHKSPSPADPATAATAHAGQLLAYAAMVETALGTSVTLLGINWLGAGTLSLAEPACAGATAHLARATPGG
nr:PD-(D/E)XK nuclease family protein [Rhodovulum tesquicola]